MMPCARLNLQIMRENKVVEVKTIGFNKGTVATRLVGNVKYDFVMAIGDDVTDDDMFRVLPDDAVTIKVGSISEYARFSLLQYDTFNFLNSLMPDFKFKAKCTLKSRFFRLLRALKYM